MKDKDLAKYLGYPEDIEFDIKPAVVVDNELMVERDGAKDFMDWMEERDAILKESDMYWDAVGGDE